MGGHWFLHDAGFCRRNFLTHSFKFKTSGGRRTPANIKDTCFTKCIRYFKPVMPRVHNKIIFYLNKPEALSCWFV